MSEEEILKAISELPKVETDTSISAYNSINVEDLAKAVDRFNKIPNYNDLFKENKQLKEDCEDLFNQKQMMFENMQLNQLKCLDLAKQLKQRDEVIDKAIRMIEINMEIIKEQPSNNKLEDEFTLRCYNNLLKILQKYKGYNNDRFNK